MLYASYGSNINLQQMAYRCPNSTVAGTAILNGYKLQFRYHATIEPQKDSKVPVVLWHLPEQDEKKLDSYEDYPRYYHKEIIELDLNGETVEVMVYIMNGNQPLKAPTAKYYDTIENGYIENGLDTSYLSIALAETVQSEDRSCVK